MALLAAPSSAPIKVQVSGAVEQPDMYALPPGQPTATLGQLDALPGIGPVRAQAILDYRAEHGPFTRIGYIINVPGIRPVTFEGLKDLITVGP